MEAALNAATNARLPVAHNTGVEETNAWDDVRFKTRSIEHWYGIPDAALDEGVQGFPPSYNYQNEADRFRYAGHLWREANWEKLGKLFDAMVAAGVTWDPTLTIYEASRDLQRAQISPGLRSTCIRRLKSFSARIWRTMDLTSSIGPPPMKRIGKKITSSGCVVFASLQSAGA